jgi:hypothetical protein
MSDSCENCRFWDRVDDYDTAKCRRFPHYETRDRDQSCGEHQPLSAKPADVNGELLAALKEARNYIALAIAVNGGEKNCEELYVSELRRTDALITRAEEASR